MRLFKRTVKTDAWLSLVPQGERLLQRLADDAEGCRVHRRHRALLHCAAGRRPDRQRYVQHDRRAGLAAEYAGASRVRRLQEQFHLLARAVLATLCMGLQQLVTIAL